MLKSWQSILLMSVFLFAPMSYADDAVDDKKTINVEQQQAQILAGPNFWREVRRGDTGFTTSTGKEHGQLINVNGQRWREIRNQWVSPIGLIFMGGSALCLFLFYVFAGKINLANQRTGKKVLRWSPFDRAMHWFTATTFLILGFSGVLILYGRYFIKPITSEAVLGTLLNVAKMSHNYIGPLFVLSLLCMLIKWFKNNLLNKVDVEWFKQGGGMLPNGKHPDAGFCNGGEKMWFWLIATVGVVVCVTGLVMDFPIFGQSRDVMQIANILHGLASLGLVAAAFGHIYIGTIGTEGVLEGMTTGYVDESWAKQHHKLWYDELESTEQPVPTQPQPQNEPQPDSLPSKKN